MDIRDCSISNVLTQSVGIRGGAVVKNHDDGRPAAILDKVGAHFTELLSKIVEHFRIFRQNFDRISGIWISGRARNGQQKARYMIRFKVLAQDRCQVLPGTVLVISASYRTVCSIILSGVVLETWKL